VGVHRRGEVLSPAELSALLDEAGVDGAERDELVERVEWGLALLDVYARQVDAEDTAHDEVTEHGGIGI
jgi:hypothetical protein